MHAHRNRETADASSWESREVAEAWRRMATVHRRVMGPATERMLGLADVGPGAHVLDVAAGTGEQTLAAAHRVGPTGHILATDISTSMLDVARDTCRLTDVHNVEWRVADARRLDLESESFDAAVSRFGIMLIPEPHEVLARIRRALKPGGKLAAMVWSAPEKNPFFTVPFGILQERGIAPPPDPSQPGMFALGSPSLLDQTFRRAGFREVAVHAAAIPWRFGSLDEAIDYYRTAAASLAKELAERLEEVGRDRIIAEIGQALRRFERPAELQVPGEALLGVGTK